MLKKTSDLIEQRTQIVEKMKAANEADNNDLFMAAEAELRSIEVQLERARKIDAADRAEVGKQVHGGEFGTELRSYSLASAINGAISGHLTGREAEIDQELKRGRESRSGGNGIHIAVPSEVLLGTVEHRDGQMVQSNPAGGWTVGTQLAPLGDRYRPRLMVEALGATVLRGLTDFLELPNLAKSGTAKWIGENQNSTRTAVEFNTVGMGPKTVSAEYRMSRRLMLQTNGTIEGLLRRDLGALLAQGLDAAAINGDGVMAPLGILQTPGVTKVAAEASAFLAATSDLIAELELDDVTGTAAFLTNPTLMNMIRKIVDGDGHVVPVSELFYGRRVEETTQVPKNFGTGGNKSPLIYGNWSELYVGYWSAVDILINPYHPDVASNGGALLHAFLDANVAVRHPQAFAYAEF